MTVIKRQLLNFLAGILLVLVVTVAHSLYYGVYRVATEEWVKQHTPYDTRYENFFSVVLAGQRLSRLKNGMSPSNPILSVLNYFHRKVYESVLTKIPASDGERVRYLYEYRLSTLIHTIPREDWNKTLVEEYLSALKIALASSYANHYMRDVGKFEIFYDFSNVLFYYTRKNNLHPEWVEEIIPELVKEYRTIDLEKFLNQKSQIEKVKPIDFTFILYRQVADEIIKSCSDQYIHYNTILEDKFYEWLPQYQKTALSPANAEELRQTIAAIEKQELAIHHYIQSNCH